MRQNLLLHYYKLTCFHMFVTPSSHWNCKPGIVFLRISAKLSFYLNKELYNIHVFYLVFLIHTQIPEVSQHYSSATFLESFPNNTLVFAYLSRKVKISENAYFNLKTKCNCSHTVAFRRQENIALNRANDNTWSKSSYSHHWVSLFFENNITADVTSVGPFISNVYRISGENRNSVCIWLFYSSNIIVYV